MFFAIRQQRYRSSSAAVGARFIAPAYTYSPRIRNSFRMHSRNVRNVFVICVLHIRRVKVWFLRCKSMVFGVQKGGFYIAKVWFLFLNVVLLQFVQNVITICQQRNGNPFAMFWQSVSNILAIRQQPQGPIYRARIYENTHKMTNGNVRVVMWKCVFNNVEIRN